MYQPVASLLIDANGIGVVDAAHPMGLCPFDVDLAVVLESYIGRHDPRQAFDALMRADTTTDPSDGPDPNALRSRRFRLADARPARRRERDRPSRQSARVRASERSRGLRLSGAFLF